MSTFYAKYPPTGGGGVTSLNGLTGALTLAAGTGITITPGVGTLTISSINTGTVTNVTASAPLSSTGGATPNISISQATTSTDGYLSSTDWNTFNNKQPALGFTPENSANKGIAGGYASLDGAGKVPYAQLPSAIMTYLGAWDASTNTPTLADGTGDVGDTYRVSVQGTQNLGSGSVLYYVGDFIIYNGTIWQRSPAADGVTSVNGFTGAVTLTQGNLTDAGTDGIVITGGTNAVWGSGTSIAQHVADATHNGYLSSTDWNAFSSTSGAAISSLTGDGTATGPGAAAFTLATVNGNVGSFTNASITVNAKGLITAASSGTAPVTSISVATANGFAGSSSGGQTPALTLTTTITGILQGDGTAISAASTTGSGAVVLATSPTLVTPALGTPSALVGTNITGTASGLTAGNINATSNSTLTTLSALSLPYSQITGAPAAITALTGDATASGPGSAALTLATVNGNVGSFGSSTAIPSFTVNAKGLITAASTNAVVAPAGTLTGTTLAANVVTSSLTSVGTITTGVWNGTTIAIANGGTGQTSASTAFNALSPITTTGDMIYSASGATNSRLPIGTAGQVLTVSGGVPAWATPAAGGTVTSVAMTVPAFLSVSGSPITSSGTLAVTLSGTALPIANGGTGQTTASAAFNALSPMTTGGDIIYGGTSGTGTRLANGTAGQLLQSNGGTSAPTWVTSGNVGATTLDSGFTPDTSFGTCSSISVWYKIVGDEMHVRGNFKSGTTTAATSKIPLPASKTIDSSKMTTNTNAQQVGFCCPMTSAGRNAFSATNASEYIFYDGSTTSAVFIGTNTGSANSFQFSKVNTSTFMSANDVLSFEFWVPIT